MGQFFKDMFWFEAGFFNFDILFGEHHIASTFAQYKYNEVMTAFLNYDITSYKKAVMKRKDADELHDLLLQMPFFKDCPSSIWGRTTTKKDHDKLLKDLILFQHYHAFFEKLGQVKAKNLPLQIQKARLQQFLPDKMLGRTGERETAIANIQYVMVNEYEPNAGIYERISFTRFLDFLYVDLYKGILKGNVPKKCKLCGAYFLLEKGAHYEYCTNIFKDNKTCREVGATVSFKQKTDNNDIWKLHQRAYKKYYARVLKGKMSKPEFNKWALDAEELRDSYLPRYEDSVRKNQPFDLSEYQQQLNAE